MGTLHNIEDLIDLRFREADLDLESNPELDDVKRWRIPPEHAADDNIRVYGDPKWWSGPAHTVPDGFSPQPR